MGTTDIWKIRRLALAVAVILITIILASVEIETPAKISPLGIPLLIKRPDLLTIGLVIVSVYSSLRYVYYGFLAQPSPMRIRRQLKTGNLLKFPMPFEPIKYVEMVTNEIEKQFPRFGNKKVTYHATAGEHTKVTVSIPPIIHVLCWIENVDYTLPIWANVAALSLWGYTSVCVS